MVASLLAAGTRASGPMPRPKRSIGAWVIIGVPVLLVLLAALQLASGFLRTDTGAHEAVAISRVILEPDPAGARVDLVVVDRAGDETTVNGDMILKVREPDGAVWESTRSLSASSFGPLPAGDFMAGRLGYSILIPTTGWARPPRHGGSGSITVTIQPSNGGAPLSTVADARFP